MAGDTVSLVLVMPGRSLVIMVQANTHVILTGVAT